MIDFRSNGWVQVTVRVTVGAHCGRRVRALILAALGVATGPGAARAASSVEAADHTPVACGAALTMADVTQWKTPAAKRPYHVEISVPSLADPYITAMLHEAWRAAQEGGVRLTVDSGEGFLDPAAQVRQLENAMSRGADALLINPADPDGLVASIDDIVARGVPVFDVGTASHSVKSYKVIQDDLAQGASAARLLAELLPKGGSGIVQAGPANALWARRRVAGFLDGLRATPLVHVDAITNEDINPAEGLAKFMNATQVHPRVDWIYASFNLLLPPPSIPAEFRNAVYIAGGYDPVMVQAVKDGTARAALLDLPGAVGYLSVGYVIAKLNAERLPAVTCLPSPVVTRANVDDPVWARFSFAPPGWKVPAR